MDANGSACVLILGLPAGSFCGIGLLSFTTSPRFFGVKHIPEGVHFLFTGANSGFSIRHGVWFRVPKARDNAPRVLIFKWNPHTEELLAEEDQAEILRWRANLGSIWKDGLTPYRQSVPTGDAGEGVAGDGEVSNDWARLTDAISDPLLSRIMDPSRTGDFWSMSSASSAEQDADDIPGLEQHEIEGHLPRPLHFLPIDLKNTWREGAVGRERTEAAQDRSWALEHLVREHCHSPQDVIGELQLTFIMVLTLNNNSCLEQWKRILGLILTCKAISVKEPSMFVRALGCLKLQLEHCSDAEGGLFDLSDEGATLLKSLLKRFRQGLEQQAGSQGKLDVMDELDELEEYLKSEHGWLMNDAHVKRGLVQLEDGEQIEVDLNGVDQDEEAGEYAPAIADADPELMEQWRLQHQRTSRKTTGGPSRLEEDSGSSDDEEIVPGQLVESEDERELDEMDSRY